MSRAKSSPPTRRPDEIYGRIEQLVAGPYLELFARFPRAGWDSWGTMDGVGERRWKSTDMPPTEPPSV